jgi:hypothetical protein
MWSILLACSNRQIFNLLCWYSSVCQMCLNTNFSSSFLQVDTYYSVCPRIFLLRPLCESQYTVVKLKLSVNCAFCFKILRRRNELPLLLGALAADLLPQLRHGSLS